jgi:long-chain acyl-CoA synthetase
VEVAKKFEELTGAVLREGYGLTETAVVTHVNPLYGKTKAGSIGLPIPSTYAAIADPDKPELSAAEPGGGDRDLRPTGLQGIPQQT